MEANDNEFKIKNEYDETLITEERDYGVLCEVKEEIDITCDDNIDQSDIDVTEIKNYTPQSFFKPIKLENIINEAIIIQSDLKDAHNKEKPSEQDILTDGCPGGSRNLEKSFQNEEPHGAVTFEDKFALKIDLESCLAGNSRDRLILDEKELKRQLILHTGRTLSKVQECDESSRDRENLKRNIKMYECSECNKRFKRKCNMKIHIVVHTIHKPFKCNECNKSFKRNDHLKRHTAIHNVHKPFKCNKCSESFNRKAELKLHIVIHKPKGPNLKGHETLKWHEYKPLKCNEYNKSFKRNNDLERNIMLHKPKRHNLMEHKPLKWHEYKPLTDGLLSGSGIAENDSKGDKTHVEGATKDKSTEWSIRHKINLKRNFKLSKCNESNESFKQKNRSKSHIAIPKKYRCFNCDECHKRFIKKSDLKTHMAIHILIKEERDYGVLCEVKDEIDITGDDKKEYSDIEEIKAESYMRQTFFKPFKIEEIINEKVIAESRLENAHIKTKELSKQDNFIHDLLSGSGIAENDSKGEEPHGAVTSKDKFALKIDLESSFAGNSRDELFFDKKEWKRHLHTGRTLSIGQQCDESSRDRKNLKRNIKMFECNECNRSFTQKAYLNKHMAIHTVRKHFKCNECNKSFKHKWHLKEHIMLIHMRHKRFQCNECKKRFKRNGDLNRHLAIHTGHKPFKCNECNKSFTHNIILKRHMAIHTGIKPFKCNECNKSFTQKCHLRSHMTHTRHKSIKCNECNKSFLRSELNSDVVIHEDLKPFKCNECNKSFTQNRNLKTYIAIHMGHKPFKCNECNKSFTRKDHLNNHMAIHLYK